MFVLTGSMFVSKPVYMRTANFDSVKKMKQILAIIIGLAILIAAPLSVLAQNADPGMPEETSQPPVTDSMPYWYYMPEMGGFNYTGGVANGTYVDFLLDETTGTISDYTSTLVDYNYFYPMVYYADNTTGGREEGYFPPEYNPEPTNYNVNFFETIAFDGFVPNGHPMVFRESLVYMGENVMMTFSDYEYSGLCFQFGESNGTMTITVPAGIEIKDVPRYYEIYNLSPDNITSAIGYDDKGDSSSTGFGGVEAPGYAPEYMTWDEAYLTSGNITCSIYVDRGTLEIVGNQIIIHTTAGASVSTSAYIDYGWTYEYQEPWFSDIPIEDDKGAIEGAIEEGLMAAIGYMFTDEAGNQYNDAETMNDPSFQLQFMNVEQDRFQVQVDSDIETGRIITLNVNKESLNAENMKEVNVLLDNEDVKACGSMEELVDMQGGTEAGYYMVSGTSQNTIFVYVPHFSTHIITVGLDASQIVNVVLPGAIAIGFIAVAVGLVYMRGKKNKEEI
jgi:hypothetical protein